MERLIELADDKMETLIGREGFRSFAEAAGTRQLSVLNRLLEFPSVFAWAELHDREYGEKFIYLFVYEQIATLRAENIALETTHPQAIFDVTSPEKAKFCFYILRNLIRRNDPTLQDDMQFLINIPSVKALLHTELTPRESNELLRLALSRGNQPAVEMLLNVPAVRELAEQNNFYRREARGALNIEALAQNRESSMTALTTGEQNRLSEAQKRYQPIIQERGVGNVMSSLRETLQSHYEMHPAQFQTSDGRTIHLPFHWKDWEKERKNYNADTQARALQAYYQHKVHTAWRYLLKPNTWMASDALYVNRDSRGGWSTFEEYQPLIAMLFLAASDKDVLPCDGYTLETRVEHFIDELAHIGRAHNWDKSRHNVNASGEVISEEYDDFEGDKPSCYSGVKRRLFQSVQGHPLFKILTLDDVKQELRDFMREHFKQCIETHPDRALQWKEAWNKAIETGEIREVLSEIDVSEEAEKSFIQKIYQKYPCQFDKEFKDYIMKRFHDKHIPMHAMAFGGEANLTSLFESCIKKKAPTTKEELRQVRLGHAAYSLFPSSDKPKSSNEKLEPEGKFGEPSKKL